MKYPALALLASVFVSQTCNAADPKFMDFVLKNAHDRGFTQCDAALRDAFSFVGGEDIRVITENGLAADSMKVVAVYGKAGDTLYTEAEFRRSGAKCRFTLTNTIVSTKSCAAEAAELPAFKYEAETAGAVFTKNSGGVRRILLPVGQQACASIFLRAGET